MTREEADAIITTIQTFVGGERGGGKTERLAQGRDGSTLVKRVSTPDGQQHELIETAFGPVTGVTVTPIVTGTKEKLFEEFKAWLLSDLREDPIFVQLLAARPELEVQLTPRRLVWSADTLKGRIGRLMASGWFSTPKTVGACRSELKRTGPDPGGGGNLSTALNDCVKDGFLTRDGEAFILAPDVKITEREVVSE